MRSLPSASARRDEIGDGGIVVWEIGAALVLAEPEPQTFGLLGHATRSALHGFGELGGMRGRQHDHGREPKAALGARGGNGDGGVGIAQNAGLLHQAANGHLRVVLADRMRGEQIAHAGKLGVVQAEGPRLAQAIHERVHPRGIAAGKLEQKALEIARKLDVHARARGGDHVLRLIQTGAQDARKTVIEVRGNNEARDR